MLRATETCRQNNIMDARTSPEASFFPKDAHLSWAEIKLLLKWPIDVHFLFENRIFNLPTTTDLE